MGFTAGIYMYPKYKNTSYKDIQLLEKVFEYETNSWAKEHFPTVEAWVQQSYNIFSMPNPDVVNFYRDKLITDDYGYTHIYQSMCNWCSNGSGDIYEWFKGKFNLNSNSSATLSYKDVVEFLQFCWDKYYEKSPQPCNLKYAYKYIDNEDDEEEAEIRLIPCDGIEVEFENGCISRLDAFGENEFAAPKQYYDEWAISGYITGIEGAIKILNTVDFDNTILIYEGGW